MSVLDILKDSIIQNDGSAIDVDTFTGKGKVFALYFSAHWCPPCRGFTPKLAEFYKQFKDKCANKPFEIVFVSSDEDITSFDGYFSEMPWLALKYEDRDKKAALSKKFKISGIPSMVIIDGETGELINNDGRSAISGDPQGEKYPWIPPTFTDIIKGNLIKNDKTTADSSILDGKIKLIYFSAHWCPPCQAFTPKLVEFYNKLKSAGKDVEIVFISGDENEKSFDDYFKTMPWYAIPFGDGRLEELNTVFEVSGIPKLIVLDSNNKLITGDGRTMVSNDGDGEEFPWYTKPLEKVDSRAIKTLSNETCVVYFTDGSEASLEKAKCSMIDIAEKHHSKGDSQELFFFYAVGGDDITKSLSNFTEIHEFPKLAILNMTEKEMFLCDKEELSKAAVESHVSDYLSGKLNPISFEK